MTHPILPAIDRLLVYQTFKTGFEMYEAEVRSAVQKHRNLRNKIEDEEGEEQDKSLEHILYPKNHTDYQLATEILLNVLLTKVLPRLIEKEDVLQYMLPIAETWLEQARNGEYLSSIIKPWLPPNEKTLFVGCFTFEDIVKACEKGHLTCYTEALYEESHILQKKRAEIDGYLKDVMIEKDQMLRSSAIHEMEFLLRQFQPDFRSDMGAPTLDISRVKSYQDMSSPNVSSQDITSQDPQSPSRTSPMHHRFKK